MRTIVRTRTRGTSSVLIAAAAAVLAALAVLAISAGPAGAGTWVVHADGSGDAPTIQAAVDASAAGDTVLVTAGVYTDASPDISGTPTVVEMKSGVALRSVDGPALTVLDVSAEEFGRGIACRGCDSNTLVEGFTLKGGEAFAGAGILVEGGAPEIAGNKFTANPGGMGGGLYVTAGATSDVHDNLFDDNEACCGPGGAILIDAGSEPHVFDNVFVGNHGFAGGAVAVQSAGGLIERNEFTGNGGTDGGALSLWSATADVRENTFVGNTATTGGGAVLFKFGSTGQFHDNLVAGNVAEGNGGGILVSASSPEISRSTVAGNSAAQGGGVFVAGSSEPVFDRVIVAMNTGAGGIVCESTGSQPSFSCTNAFGNEGGDYGGQCADPTGSDGNFSEDPKFCNGEAGDYALCSTSPCAPGGHPDGWECGLIGAVEVDCTCEQTAIEDEATWGAIKALFR
jgi:hypothetical protein